jgi:hypothetical protein
MIYNSVHTPLSFPGFKQQLDSCMERQDKSSLQMVLSNSWMKRHSTILKIGCAVLGIFGLCLGGLILNQNVLTSSREAVKQKTDPKQELQIPQEFVEINNINPVEPNSNPYQTQTVDSIAKTTFTKEESRLKVEEIKSAPKNVQEKIKTVHFLNLPFSPSMLLVGGAVPIAMNIQVYRENKRLYADMALLSVAVGIWAAIFCESGVSLLQKMVS